MSLILVMLKNTMNHFKERKTEKSAKKSELITYQSKTFDTFDVKSDITEQG